VEKTVRRFGQGALRNEAERKGGSGCMRWRGRRTGERDCVGALSKQRGGPQK
jgi:hypothetical protein